MAKNDKTTGDSKWEQSVNRARASAGLDTLDSSDVGALVKTAPTEIMTMDDLPGIGSLVENVTPEKLQELVEKLQGGKLEVGEQFVALQPGQQIAGTLRKQGTTLLPDLQNSGKMVEVKTWHFKHSSGMLFSMVGSYMLDRQLPAFMDREVTVMRGGQFKSKQNRIVSRYTCYSEAIAEVIDAESVEKAEEQSSSTSAA